ncbi:hypothetical protein Tco_0159234 [Tanacetum coccineum]
MVMGHPTDRLEICYGERFVLKPFLYTMMGDLFDQVLEADPDAFDVFVDPLFESEDHVSKGRGVDDLVLVSLEKDASSSKRFLSDIARYSF